MSRKQCQPETGYAAVWTRAKPRPFILTHTISSMASDCRNYMGKVWARKGETKRQGWERAYREGCRIKKVTVSLDASTTQ